MISLKNILYALRSYTCIEINFFLNSNKKEILSYWCANIFSIEYILSWALLLSGALLIHHLFERLKYARVKNLSVYQIHVFWKIKICTGKKHIGPESTSKFRYQTILVRQRRHCIDEGCDIWWGKHKYQNCGCNIKSVQELFFVPAKFVFVPACAEIALTFPISCAADISF